MYLKKKKDQGCLLVVLQRVLLWDWGLRVHATRHILTRSNSMLLQLVAAGRAQEKDTSLCAMVSWLPVVLAVLGVGAAGKRKCANDAECLAFTSRQQSTINAEGGKPGQPGRHKNWIKRRHILVNTWTPTHVYAPPNSQSTKLLDPRQCLVWPPLLQN